MTTGFDAPPPDGPPSPTPPDGFGVLLTDGPGPVGTWADAPASYRRLEDAGCAAIWSADHLLWGRPMPEALTMCAVAAAATTRPLIGTGVLQLPLRRTAAVARAATTLQQVSAGRFILGLGVGEHAAEYERVGARFERRGRALDAAIDELGRWWLEPDDDDWFGQRPAPSPPVPLWFGGRAAAAITRTATVGNGWMPIFVSPDQYRRAAADLDEALAANGRPAEAVCRSVTVLVAVTDARWQRQDALNWCGALWNLPPDRLDRHLVSGGRDDVLEQLDTFRAAGANHIALLPATPEPIDAFEGLG